MSEKWNLIKVSIITIAIITASLIFAFAIKNGSEYIGNAIGNGSEYIGNAIGNGLSHMSNSAASTDDRQSFDYYLSEYEASVFLKINIDDFYVFVESGELDGTFTTLQNGRIFSKEKLIQWLDDRIGS